MGFCILCQGEAATGAHYGVPRAIVSPSEAEIFEQREVSEPIELNPGDLLAAIGQKSRNRREVMYIFRARNF